MQRTRQMPGIQPLTTGTVPLPQADPLVLHIRPKRRRGRNPIIDLPIGARLTLGFLVAGLIASLVTGAIGLQQSNSLKAQSTFYENLLNTNTKLNTAASFLQLMNTETHNVIGLFSSTQVSQETLNTDEMAIQTLTKLYDQYITGYANTDLLSKHAEQIAILQESHHEQQADQQVTLTASALRTWQIYHSSQDEIIKDINSGQTVQAAHLEQFQGELTNADAQSALRALIRFNSTLATSVHDSAVVDEQNQLILTIIGAIIAFIVILLIGWFISSTIIKRLRLLRQVTQSVERGQLHSRVLVVGSDEIADVSASVNAMLETIVGLLQETRSQRDALTNAAEHLFTDMRVVSAGDLRVNTPVSNDPIGMLANAFNFTVGRFRRFVQHTKTTAEQLDVMARQELERVEAFTQALQQLKAGGSTLFQVPKNLSPANDSRIKRSETVLQNVEEQPEAIIIPQVQQTRELLQDFARESFLRQTRTLGALAEQIYTSTERLQKAVTTQSEPYLRNRAASTVEMQIQELHVLETVLKRMMSELQNTQKNVVKGFQELDDNLNRVNSAIRTLKPHSSGNLPELASSKEATSENLRLSNAFANDIASISHQLAHLAQDIRAGIIAFQLDAVENAGSLSIHTPASSAPAYNLSSGPSGSKTPLGIPGRKSTIAGK